MINKEQVSRKFGTSVQSYAEESVAQQHIALKMARLLQTQLPSFRPKQVVELGCGTGYYSRQLIHLYGEDPLMVNDLCAEMLQYCKEHVSPTVKQLAGDAEKLDLPRHTTLITSCSALQWFENPSAFFDRCLSALSREGYLAFSTFGPDNVKEVKELTGRGLHYLSLKELKKMLEPHYELCHLEEEHLTYTFTHPLEVLRHLKKTGVTALNATPMTPAALRAFQTEYAVRFGAQDGVTLTYHPLYVVARKKEARAYVTAPCYQRKSI